MVLCGSIRLTVAALEGRMNENANEGNGTATAAISDYVVMFLRNLTSAELQNREDFFSPFIAEEAATMELFRQRRVDPMGEEADQLHIIALVDAIGVAVRVEYLDGSGDGASVNHHDFVPADKQAAWATSGREPSVCLLYRPGHYDILYPNEREIERQKRAAALAARSS